MNELKVINEQEVLGKHFRIYGTTDEPLFLAKDVAEWIEYDKSSINKMLQSVDEDEKVRKIVPTLGGTQESWFLTENGLYEVLMLSRKPIAKEFKKKIKEILHSIRKTGGYVANDDLFINTYLPTADDATKLMFRTTLATVRQLNEEKRQLQQTVSVQAQQISEMQPKVTYYDIVLNCKDLVAISVIAKDYGWSTKHMNQYLHEKGVQYKQGSIWLLYQKYASNGYTSTRTYTYQDWKEEAHTDIRTYWTQKGRLFIYELMKSDGNLPLIEQEGTIKYEH